MGGLIGTANKTQNGLMPSLYVKTIISLNYDNTFLVRICKIAKGESACLTITTDIGGISKFFIGGSRTTNVAVLSIIRKTNVNINQLKFYHDSEYVYAYITTSYYGTYLLIEDVLINNVYAQEMESTDVSSMTEILLTDI